MAKPTILKERGTGEELYPQTLASLVHTSTGENVEEAVDEAKFKVFVDMWNKAAGSYGTYNAETGYFELNGITDITYEEAIEIFLVSGNCLTDTIDYSTKFSTINCRTIFPIKALDQPLINRLAFQSPNLEIIAFTYGVTIRGVNCYSAFGGCKKLKKIIGSINTNQDVRFYGVFNDCEKLEDITINFIHTDISFKDSPLLSLESLTHMITRRQDTNNITITVHKDVYAKLTGDTTNAAAAALTEEEAAAWNQILVDAAAKNITFATT